MRLAGVHVDGDHREVDGEHVEAEGLAEAGVLIVAGADFRRAVGVEYLGLRVALVEGRDVLGYHLVVSAVGSVGLAHRVEELVAAVDDGVSDHDLAAARGGGSAVRGLRCVGEDELYLLGTQVKRLERLVRGADAAHVGALSVVFPGIVDGDAVFGELDVARSFVGSVVVGVVDAYRDSDAVLDLIVRKLGCFLFHFFVVRTRLLHHFGKREYFRRVARRELSTRVLRKRRPFEQVHLAEIERVYAALVRKHIYRGLAAPVGLRRAVCAEGRAPAVVAPAGVACYAHILIGVRSKEELSALVRKVVRGLAERTVIDPIGLLGSDDLAVLVRADADVHEERRTFRRADVVLLHVDAHIDGASACDERDRKVGLVGRGDFVTERSSEVVLDDADSRRRDADAARNHHLVAVDAYRL